MLSTTVSSVSVLKKVAVEWNRIRNRLLIAAPILKFVLNPA